MQFSHLFVEEIISVLRSFGFGAVHEECVHVVDLKQLRKVNIQTRLRYSQARGLQNLVLACLLMPIFLDANNL